MLDRTKRPIALPFVENGPVYTPGSTPTNKPSQKVWKLSSNESPIGTGSKAAEAITAAATNQHLYPEPNGQPLANAVAEKFGLDRTAFLSHRGQMRLSTGWSVGGRLKATKLSIRRMAFKVTAFAR